MHTTNSSTYYEASIESNTVKCRKNKFRIENFNYITLFIYSFILLVRIIIINMNLYCKKNQLLLTININLKLS